MRRVVGSVFLCLYYVHNFMGTGSYCNSMISLSDALGSGCAPIKVINMLHFTFKKVNFAGHVKNARLTSNVKSSNSDQNICSEKDRAKNFEEIPGPTSYPIIGTLHKYMPFFGKYFIGIF